jgi:hypothetical protein
MMRQQHDCAHRMAIRLLRLIAPALREEEHGDFYEEAMIVLTEELEALETRRRREADRLVPTGNLNEGGTPNGAREPTQRV